MSQRNDYATLAGLIESSLYYAAAIPIEFEGFANLEREPRAVIASVLRLWHGLWDYCEGKAKSLDEAMAAIGTASKREPSRCGLLDHAALATIIDMAVALWEACPDQFPGRPTTRREAIRQQLVAWEMHWEAQARATQQKGSMDAFTKRFVERAVEWEKTQEPTK